jgi:7-cyano-7-deazaguanine tRNA-ribosyltransferase
VTLNPKKAPTRSLVTKSGAQYRLPLFLPVYEHKAPFISIEELKNDFAVEGIITNAFFLYKERAIRERLLDGTGIKNYYGFDGLIVTDSGAFQGFQRPLLLSNKKIISFQQEIGADVVSPLDVVTPPGENSTIAQKKMLSTLKRVREGLDIIKKCILIGVQQGGRFMELRRKALEILVTMGVEYIALGSLVPFFNRNHDLSFVCNAIKDAREIIPSEVPIHIYGAGDPVEIPFYAAFGADIFDSSSFAHYARDGWYMAPYGAVKDRRMLDDMGEECISHYIEDTEVFDEKILARHNLHMIMLTFAKIRKALREGKIYKYLDEILDVNSRLFPESKLKPSYEKLAERL